VGGDRCDSVMQDAVEPFTAEVRANFDRFIRIQVELACLQENDA